MTTREDWRPERGPDESLVVGELIVRRYVADDAEELDKAISASVEHLAPWMPWIAHEPLTIEQRRALILEWSAEWDERSDFTMGIFDGPTVVGGTGLHLRGEPRSVEIGYWVRVDRTGQGIATRVVRALADAAFALHDIDRVEIHHDVANAASGRVAEAARFAFEREYDRAPSAPAEIGRAKVWVSARGR